jgi:pimeloyl-ACP methyl ester carboxylesterase
MHVLVNGVKLFFDVEGAKVVPEGSTMRERPTLVLLHGGPGFDHVSFKPAYSALADVAQIVYLDHRGNGRSDDGPSTDLWTLAQWGDDVAAFCDTLGIVKPIVLGVSFGGMVAEAYATRHPAHPSKLALISTRAAGSTHRERCVELFEQFGGPEVGALARRRFLETHGQPDQAAMDAWRRHAMPHYTRKPRDISRSIHRPKVLHHFSRPGGEGMTMDMTADLKRLQCPTLVVGGEADPMTPIECQQDIAAAIPRHLVRFERFADAGHGVVADREAEYIALIRQFVTGA